MQKIEPFACTRLLIAPELLPRSNVVKLRGFGPDRQEWEFVLTTRRMRAATAVSVGETMTLAKCVPHVLSDPNSRVFQGLRSDGIIEGLCYVGSPPSKYDAIGTPKTPGDDECFFVFVCEERTVYTWRWEIVPAEKQDETFNGRFTRRVR